MPTTDDEPGWWFLPSPAGEGTVVANAHRESMCRGGPCCLHNPSQHWASAMPMKWVYDREGTLGPRMLRICPHGFEHDDPDDLEYRARIGRDVRRGDEAPCGCPCACRHAPPF